MKNLRTVFVGLLLPVLVLVAPFAQASVTASLDQNPVVRGQAVTLTIRVEDEKGEPDLGVLGDDFRVLGQSTSSQVQYINGSLSQWKDWVIQLMPLREGSLSIPAIPVGKAASQPLTLTVTKQSASASQEAWIEFSVSPKQAWQGQQLLVKAQLYYAASVRSGELTKPEVSNAIIEQLGEDSTEQLVRNGVRYSRLTRRYVVFPERAGSFRIGGPVFNGQAEAARAPSRSFGGLFRNTRPVTAVADDVTVSVKAAPAGADFWLPAQDVTLSAGWGDGGSVPEFRVGQPVTRVVTLRAYGLLATQLPDLQLDYPGVRSYPEAAEQETGGGPQGVVGVRNYRSAIIPQQAGSYRLPEVRVKWWDVARGEWATAVLPEETIDVLPAAGGAAVPVPLASEPCDVGAPAALAAPASADAPRQCDEAVTTDPALISAVKFWKVATVAVTALWLLSLLFLLWLWRRRPAGDSAITASTAASFSQQKNQLLRACSQHNATGAAQALAKLASAAGLGVTSPSAVAATVDSPELAAALRALDAACYGGNDDWRGDDLQAALKASAWPDSKQAETASALPSLYPQ